MLRFIEAFSVDKGYCPSYEEIASACKLKSKSNIHYRLKELEERGYIKHVSHKRRAIEVLKGVPKGRKK